MFWLGCEGEPRFLLSTWTVSSVSRAARASGKGGLVILPIGCRLHTHDDYGYHDKCYTKFFR